MPVILDPEEYDLWLDPSVEDRERLEAALEPLDVEKMIAYPVSTRVNSPANDEPSVIEPQGEAERASPEAEEQQPELF
jgi:putative SOS response-associated peptidase YedK